MRKLEQISWIFFFKAQSGFGVWPGGNAAGFRYYCWIVQKKKWDEVEAFLGKMFWSCSGEAHLGCSQ